MVKSVIVTGAGRGIGLAITEQLAGEGFRVAMMDSAEDRLGPASQKLIDRGFDIVPVVGDIMSPDSVEGVIQLVGGSGGRVAALVNNVGISTPKISICEEVDFKEWMHVLDVNVCGTFQMCQCVGREMIRRGDGGAIVNIASIYGMRSLDARLYSAPGDPKGYDDSPYHVSKAAILQLTRTLAVSWAPFNIRVNSVSPGPIDTMSEDNFVPGDVRGRLLQNVVDRVPMGRTGRPGEIAAGVSFLISDEASYITGTNLIVDGGWTCI